MTSQLALPRANAPSKMPNRFFSNRQFIVVSLRGGALDRTQAMPPRDIFTIFRHQLRPWRSPPRAIHFAMPCASKSPIRDAKTSPASCSAPPIKTMSILVDQWRCGPLDMVRRSTFLRDELLSPCPGFFGCNRFGDGVRPNSIRISFCFATRRGNANSPGVCCRICRPFAKSVPSKEAGKSRRIETPMHRSASCRLESFQVELKMGFGRGSC